jgi:hypothetical protein
MKNLRPIYKEEFKTFYFAKLQHLPMLYKDKKPDQRDTVSLPSFQQLLNNIERKNYWARPQPISILPQSALANDRILSRPLRFPSMLLRPRDSQQEYFEFLVHFFSTSENLFECLRKMKVQFTKCYNLSISPEKDVLVASNSTWSTREDFRRFVSEIPPDMCANISRGMYRLSHVLSKLKETRNHKNGLLKLPGMPEHPMSMVPRKIRSKVSSRKSSLKTSLKSLRTSQSALQKRVIVAKKEPKLPKKVASICSHCTIKDTPEWRKGPNGSRSLCNACGLFYSKLVKKFGTKDASAIFHFRRDSDATMDRTIPSEKNKNYILELTQRET